MEEGKIEGDWMWIGFQFTLGVVWALAIVVAAGKFLTYLFG